MGKSLAKNSLYNILYRVVTALYPLIAVTYVSHILQSEKIGMVSYAQNIVSYFVVFAALGIPTYGTREVARCSTDYRARNKLFSELITINFISTSISLIAYIVLILNIQRFCDNLLLYIVAGTQIALNYINVDWVYYGLEEYQYISVRSIIVKIISIILLPFVVRSTNDYINYAFLYCLAIAGNNVFNIVRLKKYTSFNIRNIKIYNHIKPIMTLLIASLAVEIYVMIDTTMLGIFCNNETVGCYSNAMKLTRTVNTMAEAIGAVLLPRLSVVFEEGRFDEYDKLVNAGVKVMLMIAIPAALGIILLSNEIVLLLFGDSFIEAIGILKILALMVPIVVCNTLLGAQVLITTNMETKYAVSVAVASVVNVILNGLLIPKYGATSAAFASLLSEVIDLILYLYFARKYVIIKFSSRLIISTVLPLLIYVGFYYAMLGKLEGNLLTLVINILVCLLCYFGIGLLLKNEAIMFTFDKAKRLLSPKKKAVQ